MDEPIVAVHPLREVVRDALARAQLETGDRVAALTAAARAVRQAVPELGFLDAYSLVLQIWLR